MIRYKNVFEQLKEAGYTNYRIRTEKLIGQATLQNIRDGKMVSLDTIDTICTLTQKRVEDIIEFVPEIETQVKQALDKCLDRLLQEYEPEDHNVFSSELIQIPIQDYYTKINLYMKELGFWPEEILKCDPEKINYEYIENVAAGKEVHFISMPEISRTEV